MSTLWTLKQWMVVYLFMSWIDSYTDSVTGHQVIGSSDDVLTKEGDDVILPCHIDPPVSMEKETVEWTRPDLKQTSPDQKTIYVYFLQDGRYKSMYTNPLYKLRTFLFGEELSHGNISLKLSRVRLSDQGTYRCSAITTVPLLHSISLIELRVAKRPAQQHVIYIPPQGVLTLLPDTSSVTKPFSSILWKHGPNKAAEWDLVLGPVVDYYGTFKNRAELDKETGQLVINNMTIEDGGEYSVHINGRLQYKTYTVKQMKKVPKPVVVPDPTCDLDSISCEVHCILLGDVTESGPVTYLWKKDEGEWMVSDSGPNSNRLTVTKDEDEKVKTLTCEVKNEFSRERSPDSNYLYYEGPTPEPPPKPTPTGGIVGGVIVALILVFIVGVVVLWVKYPDRIRRRFPCLQPAPDRIRRRFPCLQPAPVITASSQPPQEELTSLNHNNAASSVPEPNEE